MSKIWLIMLLSSLATALFTDPSVAISAMLTGATDSVALAMELVAVYGVWLGFFALLDKTGVADIIVRKPYWSWKRRYAYGNFVHQTTW